MLIKKKIGCNLFSIFFQFNVKVTKKKLNHKEIIVEISCLMRKKKELNFTNSITNMNKINVHCHHIEIIKMMWYSY
jgi:hypothetical protein